MARRRVRSAVGCWQGGAGWTSELLIVGAHQIVEEDHPASDNVNYKYGYFDFRVSCIRRQGLWAGVVNLLRKARLLENPFYPTNSDTKCRWRQQIAVQRAETDMRS